MQTWQKISLSLLLISFPIALGGFYIGNYEGKKSVALSGKALEAWVDQQERKIAETQNSILAAKAEMLKHEERKSALLAEVTSARTKIDSLLGTSTGTNDASNTKAAKRNKNKDAAVVEATPEGAQAQSGSSKPGKFSLKSIATKETPVGLGREIALATFFTEGEINKENIRILSTSVDPRMKKTPLFVAGLTSPTDELREFRKELKELGMEILRLNTPEGTPTIIIPEEVLK